LVHKAHYYGKTMVTGIHTACSALNAFSTKMAVVANNVANASSNGFEKRRANLLEAPGGGVKVSIQKIPTTIEYPYGNDPSDKETSNVDLAEETIHIILSEEGFEANIRSLQAHDEIQRTALDIIA
jgi:flagellar basal-body rod protein FlgC